MRVLAQHPYTAEDSDEVECGPGPRAPLDTNHTHFLFVDAGPKHTGAFGKEIEMRAALEDSFCLYDELAGVDEDGDDGKHSNARTVMVTVVVG